MPLSNDAREWLIKEFFFLSGYQSTSSPGQWTLHICDSLPQSPTVAQVNTASRGTLSVGDATAGTTSPNRLQDFWEYNSTVDANNDGSTGGVRNKVSMAITASAGGDIDTFAIVMEDVDENNWVWAYGDAGSTITLNSGDGIAFAAGAIEFEIA